MFRSGRIVLCAATLPAVVTFVVVIGFDALSARAQGITEIIALSGSAAPDGNGTLSTFFAPVLNDAGQVAFSVNLTGTSGGTNDDYGIYRGTVGSLTQIAREKAATTVGSGLIVSPATPAINNAGQVAFNALFLRSLGLGGGTFDTEYLGDGGPLSPVVTEGNVVPDGNGAFGALSTPWLNSAGQVAFDADLTGTSGGTSDDSGIYIGDATTRTQIVREGQAAPDGNGTFSTPVVGKLNDAGQVAFLSVVNGTSGGTTDDIGVFLGDGTTLTQMAREGQAAPDGNGVLSNETLGWYGPVLNNAGQITFAADVTGTSGGSSDNFGVFRSDGTTLTQIARKGQSVANGNGTILAFPIVGHPTFNDAGQVAFYVVLTGTSGGTSDNTGLLRGDGATLTQLIREGQTAPDGNGTVSNFSNPALNDAGQAAFSVTLTGTSGGATDDSGIFLANGFNILQVAREGQSLAGSTITELSLASVDPPGGDESSWLNDDGQVVYLATLANGSRVVARYTIPDIHWTLSGGGAWEVGSSWTQSTVPNSFHDAFIDPTFGLTVTGPSQSSGVKSLLIGATSSGVAELRLQATGQLTVLEYLTVESLGKLSVNGSVATAALGIDNYGEIDLGSGGQVNGGAVYNYGTLRGSGTVGNSAVYSYGRIQAIGTQMQFVGHVDSFAGAQIDARDAQLEFDGGLTNYGRMNFSFGTSDVFGNVDNVDTGETVISGNSNISFYDSVIHSGDEIRVTTGSTAVFFGDVSGPGAFTGTGTVHFEGTYAPGASPAIVSFGNDVAFGPTATLLIELGGTLRGTQYDGLEIAGSVTLDGALDVELIDSFVLEAGNSFDILDWGTLDGEFVAINLPTLAGLAWNTSQLYTIGVLSVETGLAGDYSNNGEIDAADYTAWRDTLEAASTFLPNDPSPGAVDESDFLYWRAHFGETSGAGALSAVAVPEPATLVLLLLVVPIAFRRRAAVS